MVTEEVGEEAVGGGEEAVAGGGGEGEVEGECGGGAAGGGVAEDEEGGGQRRGRGGGDDAEQQQEQQGEELHASRVVAPTKHTLRQLQRGIDFADLEAACRSPLLRLNHSPCAAQGEGKERKTNWISQLIGSGASGLHATREA